MISVIIAGITINAIGAIVLLIYSIQYYKAFKEAKRLPVKLSYLKAQWLKKRCIGFGLLIAGSIISLIGCYL